MSHLNSEKIFKFCLLPKNPAKKNHSHYFQSGRQALLSLLRSLDNLDSKIILLPSYVPEGIFAPVIAAGLKVQFYPIKSNLSPCWKSLSKLLDLIKPDVAIIIHYFGVPQDVKRFSELCRNVGTFVVEDRSHLIALPECEFINYSDVIITSLPKIFGFPDGASLMLADRSSKVLSLSYDSKVSNYKYIASQFAVLTMNTISNKLSAPLSIFINKISSRLFQPYSILMVDYTIVRPMSLLSMFLMAHTDETNVAKRRIEIANLYSTYLNCNIFKHFIKSPPETHGMFGYPVLVSDREHLIYHLELNGVYGTTLTNRWDFRKDAGFTLKDGSEKILRNHFLFPLSEKLSNADVMKIIDIANRWVKTT